MKAGFYIENTPRRLYGKKEKVKILEDSFTEIIIEVVNYASLH